MDDITKYDLPTLTSFLMESLRLYIEHREDGDMIVDMVRDIRLFGSEIDRRLPTITSDAKDPFKKAFSDFDHDLSELIRVHSKRLVEVARQTEQIDQFSKK